MINILRLERLIGKIDTQNLSSPPAQTLKKFDSQDTVIGVLSFRHQKMYRLLLQYEDEVEDLIDRLTDSIEFHFEESSSKGYSGESRAEFHAFIKQKLAQEYFKVKQYRWLKINFDAEMETLFKIPSEKFIGIREGTTVVYRDDNNRGDQSRAEEFSFNKNECALVLSGMKRMLTEIFNDSENEDPPYSSSSFLNN